MRQPVILRLNRRVAFAGRLDQAFHVGDFDVPAAVMDEVCLLQRVGHQRNAVARAPIIWAIDSWVSTSLSLPERSRVCSRHRASRDSTVCEALQPAVCWTCAYTASPCRTSAVRERDALVPRRCEAGRDRSSRRRRAPAPPLCSTRPDRRVRRTHRNAVAADHRDLHMLAARELHDQRNDASVREICALERFVDFDQHRLRAEIGDTQMRRSSSKSSAVNEDKKPFGERGLKSRAVSALRAKPVSRVQCMTS